MKLHLPSFGGGVALEGSADSERTDEILDARGFDLAQRGQLIVASDLSPYTDIHDGQGNPLSAIYGIAQITIDNVPYVLVVGQGVDSGPLSQFYAAIFARDGEANPVPGGKVFLPDLPIRPPIGGTNVTVAQLPGVFIESQNASPNTIGAALVNFGAREGQYPATNLGLYVIAWVPGSGPAYTLWPIEYFDSLGTGPDGEFNPGSHSKRLFPRGIVAFNNHVFAWGYDSADATNGDGPNRVMFSNPGNPLKWGNDNIGAYATDRLFTDSDAIVLGAAGEIIRGAIVWDRRLWFGTNTQLHYIGGSSRDSFLTDGSQQVANSFNVIGPYAMVEGPDKKLYGVSDRGLWRTADGVTFEPLFEKLVDFAGHSVGWWDLIYTDEGASVNYPGRTNQDLVQLVVDWEHSQVIVVIPFCDAAAGFSGGSGDTVLIKYHTRTGGFTKQLLLNAAYRALHVRRAGQQRDQRFYASSPYLTTSVQRYGYVTGAGSPYSPMLPTLTPECIFGEYAAFGPDGSGVYAGADITVAWESSAFHDALPLVLGFIPYVDGEQGQEVALYIQPNQPGLPIQLVSRTDGFSAASIPSLSASPQNHSDGNLLYVFVDAQNGGGDIAVTDDAGNTYVQIGTILHVGSSYLYQYFAKNIIGRANNVVKATGPSLATYTAITVREFSGCDATAPLCGLNQAGGTGTALSTGAISVPAQGAVVCAGMRADGGSLVPGTGYALDAVSGGGGFTADEYNIASGLISNVPAMASAATGVWGIVGAAFKAAAYSPITGDVWVDTSGTDQNIGNGGGGGLIPGHPNDYIVKRYVSSWAKWVHVGAGGQQQGDNGLTRVTVGLAWTPQKGSRLRLIMSASAQARFQIEGLAIRAKARSG